MALQLDRRAVALAVPGLSLPAALLLWRTGHPFLGGVALIAGLDVAIVVVMVGWARARRVLPTVAPVLASTVIGLYGATDQGALRSAAYGDPGFGHRAGALAGLGLLCAVLLALGVDVARGIAWAVERIGRGLGLLAAGVVFTGLLVPSWAWSKLRRRDPLRGKLRPGSTWSTRTGAPSRATSLGSSLGDQAGRRSLTGRLTWGIGCVVLLLAANYGAGWAWDRAAEGGAVPEQVAARADIDPTTRDPRADLPAMAAYPWRDRYFADIQRTPGGYWPFTEYRPDDFTSPYVNIKGWLRKSYQPTGNPKTMPTVWMFSGSTTWGEGQRDDYTIASWISRLAERDGLPLRIDNYGERGWTHFQEMILYEQQLGLRPAPDLSIFYDGANEITAQSLLNEAVPTHTLAYTYAQKLTGQTVATRFVQQPEPDSVVDDLYHAYSEHSAIHKVAAWLRPSPAGATPAQADPGKEFTGGQEQQAGGGITAYDLTDQDGIDAGKVYEQGKRLTLALSEQHGVEPFLFWQPVRADGPPQQKARTQLTSPTIDISDALVGRSDVFIDGGHTNEEGARIVAVDIWKRLKPAVQKWYEEHR